MAWLPNPIACDVCGAVKQPSNHWYFVEILPPPESNPYFAIYPWNERAEDRSKAFKHICGQACAIRLLNEFMGGSDNPPEPRPVLKPDPTAPRAGSFEQVSSRVRRELAQAALGLNIPIARVAVDMDLPTGPKQATDERTTHPSPQPTSIQPQAEET